MRKNYVNIILHIIIEVSLIENIEQTYRTPLIIFRLNGFSSFFIDTHKVLLHILQGRTAFGRHQCIYEIKISRQFLLRHGEQFLKKSLSFRYHLGSRQFGIHIVHRFIKIIQ